MNAKNAIVLIIDGLGTSHLGPYGISSAATDAFNRLASESIVADHATIDSSEPSAIYRSMMRGGHAGFSRDLYDNRPSLAKLASEHNIHSLWFGDQPSIAEIADANDFRRKIVFSEAIESRDDALMHSIEETWMARFFSESVEALTGLNTESNLAWIHCPGLIAPWDAPAEFRTRFLGPDDPDPPLSSKPPSMFAESDDPDKRFGFECAYAGQVLLLDVMLDAFLQSVESLGNETLFILAGLRGFPLGQHGEFGVSHDSFQPELTHVPIFVRHPQSSGSLNFENHFRLSWLVQPGDIFATIASWFDVPRSFAGDVDLGLCLEEPQLEGRKLAVAVNETELAIRTRHWFARCFASPGVGDQDKSGYQLYLKPDDRWNSNDVARRCPAVVADLKSFQETCRDCLSRGELCEECIPTSLTTPPE